LAGRYKEWKDESREAPEPRGSIDSLDVFSEDAVAGDVLMARRFHSKGELVALSVECDSLPQDAEVVLEHRKEDKKINFSFPLKKSFEIVLSDFPRISPGDTVYVRLQAREDLTPAKNILTTLSAKLL